MLVQGQLSERPDRVEGQAAWLTAEGCASIAGDEALSRQDGQEARVNACHKTVVKDGLAILASQAVGKPGQDARRFWENFIDDWRQGELAVFEHQPFAHDVNVEA